jgi:hypothetical protein
VEARGASLTSALRLIRGSHYLCHLCVFLFMNAMVSSMFYFTKTLMVAHSGLDTSSLRTAWFAAVNSMSAGVMLVLQVGSPSLWHLLVRITRN